MRAFSSAFACRQALNQTVYLLLRCGVGMLLISTVHAGPVVIQLGAPADKPFRGTTQIGLNLEMSLISDRMWRADDHWMARTLSDAGVRTLRWGYSAIWWDALAEKPLTENYWSAENTKDAAGSFGFREFVEYCRETRTIPQIMLPVDALASGVPLQRVLELSRKMAEYVASGHLETPVYLEAGNEPYTKPKLARVKYVEALRALYPLVKSIHPDFRVVAQINEDLQPYVTDACADSFDAVEWHHYLECGGKGKDPWQWYCQQNNADLFRLARKREPVIPAGKEYLIGEINVLWPDWDCPMGGDLRSSLVYLNLLLDAIKADQAAAILPWPSHWPSHKGVAAYGLFDYDSFTHHNRRRTFPAVLGVHRLIRNYVLSVPVTLTSSDPKVRAYGYASVDQTSTSIILINKYSTAVSVCVPLDRGMDRTAAHQLRAGDSAGLDPEYTAVAANPDAANSMAFSLPAESACGILFHRQPPPRSP